MAKNTIQFKTPIVELLWVKITGDGKLKMNKDGTNGPSDYQFTATAIYPDKAAMEVDKAKFDQFWRDNRPAGCTKQKYTMFKPEFEPALDEIGKEQLDEDGAVIKRETGRYTLAAKTSTQWPDGKPNHVKTLRANGNPVNLGDKEIGNDSRGIIHGTVGINDYAGNEGLAFYLNAIQLIKFVEYTGGGAVDAEDLGDGEGFDNIDMDNAEVADESGPTI